MGVPERFVANYKASQRFLERLEALSSTTRALEAFRGSVAYQSWLDRWKLSVYYGLCFQVYRPSHTLSRLTNTSADGPARLFRADRWAKSLLEWHTYPAGRLNYMRCASANAECGQRSGEWVVGCRADCPCDSREPLRASLAAHAGASQSLAKVPANIRGLTPAVCSLGMHHLTKE